MDTIGSIIFFGGARNKFKYHVMKRENVCLIKDFGSLGIINTKVLNEALLFKWVWRICNSLEDYLCCSALKVKHLRNRSFANR